METEAKDLARQLCTRAGCIMEDASVIALVWDDGMTLDQRLRAIATAANQIAALMAAAQALRCD